MSDNNNNEAEALFATRRKKQQDEEAQKAAKLAEEQRLAEIERQKQEVAQEIERLEKLQAQQKEQEEKQRLLEEQAQAEKAAKMAADAQKAASGNTSSTIDIKKYLPFILIGVGVLVVAVVVIIIVASSSKSKETSDDPDNYAYYDEDYYDEDYDGDYDNSLSFWLTQVDWYRETASNGVTFVYPSLFERTETEDADEYRYYYLDTDSNQYVNMQIIPSTIDEDGKAFATDSKMKLILGAMLEEYGITDYQAESYGDNFWYACDSLDDKDANGEMSIIISGIGDVTALDLICTVGHEDAGLERTIDIQDILYMASIMLNKLSVG